MVNVRAIWDGLQTALGMGSAADPRERSRYRHCALDRGQIEAAYRGSGLIRKIIDIPAGDMTREWRVWQADATQITALEAEERRLQIRSKVRQAEVLRGLGGGAMILGAPGEPSQPLPANISRGGLAYVHVVSRYQLTFDAVVDDPLDPLFGGPAAFRMQTSRGEILLHPSRVVCFRGDPLPQLLGVSSAEEMFWGASRIERILDAAKNCDAAQSAFAGLIQKAKLTRIGIPNLLEMTATDEGSKILAARFAAMAAGESIYSVTITDTGRGDGDGETISDHQVSWAGIPDIMYAFATFLAGVADIPLTRLIGRAAEGMNASGESQRRDFAQHIRAKQELELRPCLDQIDTVLIPSALGSRPAEVWWEYVSLDHPTQAEEAARFKTTMEAVEKLQMTAAIPDEAFNRALQSTMIENGFMPGLEGALDELPEDERYGVSVGGDGDDDPSALQAQ